MPNMFLNDKELESFTGCKTSKAQAAYLKSLNVKHYVNAIGRVVVVRSLAENINLKAMAPDPFTKAINKKNFITFHKKTSGVYFLRQKDVVVYVGKTSDLFSRMAQHIRGGYDFDEISFVPLKLDVLDTYEQEYIARFCPKYNVMHNKPNLVEEFQE